MPKAGWWALAALWAGVIFSLSHSADLPGGATLLDAVPFADKLAHAGVFAVLAGLIFQATKLPPLTLLLTMFYGLSDELHQGFIDGRDSDVADWFADGIGASLAILWLSLRQWQAERV